MYFSRAFLDDSSEAPLFKLRVTVTFHGYLDWIDEQSDLPQQIRRNIAPSFRLHSYRTDIYRLLACATISLGYLLVHPEQIGNKVIIQNRTGRSPAASVPAAMWELNRNGKAISPSIARTLPPHIEMLNQKHTLLFFLCNEREKKMKEGLAGKSIVAVAHVSSHIGVRERESSLGWDDFYIILCHQTTPHLILSSAYQTNPFPSCCSFPFVSVRWESTHAGLVHLIAH